MKSALLCAALLVSSIACLSQSSDWKAVSDAIGRSGSPQPHGVMKFSIPRSDLHVKIGDVDVKPGLALGGWVAFSSPGKDAHVMGDLVLLESETPAVMDALQSGGIEVTALHNHLLSESPRVMYMHVHGHGDAAELAHALANAIGKTAAPAPKAAAGANGQIDLDTKQIDAALGRSGKNNGGIYQVSVPRKEPITDHGWKIPNSMGIATGINFQPTGGGKAAITGDFVLLASEVNPVIKALRATGIQVTALHSHMLTEQPRVFFMHFWANDDAVKLAKGLRAAIDKTDSQPAK
jgi:hypothetical protein